MPAKRHKDADPSAGVEQAVKQASLQHVRDAEIALLSERLRCGDVLRAEAEALGEDFSAYWRRLDQRRQELLGQARDESASSGPILPGPGEPGTLFTHEVAWANSLRLHARDALLGWKLLAIPRMADNFQQTPGLAGTFGQFDTTSLGAGSVSFRGQPGDATGDPNTKWWVHNWVSQAVFPRVTEPGVIEYRFTVNGDLTVYHAPCRQAIVYMFVTVGRSSDVDNSSPFAPQNLGASLWPVDGATFPQTGHFFGKSLAVSGEIQVKRGRSAALGLIYGVLAGIAGGYVQGEGDFSARWRRPEESYTAADVGYLQYRFRPAWVDEAIGPIVNRLAEVGP